MHFRVSCSFFSGFSKTPISKHKTGNLRSTVGFQCSFSDPISSSLSLEASLCPFGASRISKTTPVSRGSEAQNQLKNQLSDRFPGRPPSLSPHWLPRHISEPLPAYLDLPSFLWPTLVICPTTLCLLLPLCLLLLPGPSIPPFKISFQEDHRA